MAFLCRIHVFLKRAIALILLGGIMMWDGLQESAEMSIQKSYQWQSYCFLICGQLSLEPCKSTFFLQAEKGSNILYNQETSAHLGEELWVLKKESTVFPKCKYHTSEVRPLHCGVNWFWRYSSFHSLINNIKSLKNTCWNRLNNQYTFFPQKWPASIWFWKAYKSGNVSNSFPLLFSPKYWYSGTHSFWIWVSYLSYHI